MKHAQEGGLHCLHRLLSGPTQSFWLHSLKPYRHHPLDIETLESYRDYSVLAPTLLSFAP